MIVLLGTISATLDGGGLTADRAPRVTAAKYANAAALVRPEQTRLPEFAQLADGFRQRPDLYRPLRALLDLWQPELCAQGTADEVATGGEWFATADQGE